MLSQSTEEGKIPANILDESDEEKKLGTGNIPMSPQGSRKNSLSSNPQSPPPDEKKIKISDVEL